MLVVLKSCREQYLVIFYMEQQWSFNDLVEQLEEMDELDVQEAREQQQQEGDSSGIDSSASSDHSESAAESINNKLLLPICRKAVDDATTVKGWNAVDGELAVMQSRFAHINS